jgi:hypothetical protein
MNSITKLHLVGISTEYGWNILFRTFDEHLQQTVDKYINGAHWDIIKRQLHFRKLPNRAYSPPMNYYSVFFFDVHMNVNRDKCLIVKPTRCTNFSNLFLEWNSTCFAQSLCPSSGVIHCKHSNVICHNKILQMDKITSLCTCKM